MKKTRWKLFAAVAAILILPFLVVLYFEQHIRRSEAQHRADIALLLQDIPCRKSTRYALITPVEPGNAWELLRPAFDAVGELYPIAGDYSYDDRWDPDLDWHGVPGETAPLIAKTLPSLELCRRAIRRTTLEWTGPVDPQLPAKAGRICRALCTKAKYCWDEGRDTEAAEWIVVALGVAQDVARLGQNGTWSVLTITEQWACEEARHLFSAHELSVADLDAFAHRIELLRAQRHPAFVLQLRVQGATLREQILEGKCAVEEPGVAPGVGTPRRPEEYAGWKDFYSQRYCRIRVLNGIRDGIEALGEVDPSIPYSYGSRGEGVRARYPAEHVGQLLPKLEADEALPIGIELLRIAVACARVEAITGRFPLSTSDLGIGINLNRSLSFTAGEVDARSSSIELELLWAIRRRTKN